ncbi:hypothetical protein LXA43DRAFT_992392, partial [Ganoderma leucocontextum]
MTDSDSRSTKRRRTSTSSPALVIVAPGDPSEPAKDQETFTRHADFWLEDGNLVLLAGATAFRVFRSILVKKSAVFADMVAAGSADATETFDDCPVVRLPDDPEDLRDFLQYLMPCSALRLRFGVPMCDFSELHAAIRLAHKYQCADVETRALLLLKKYYTSHFTEYDMYDPSRSALSPPSRSAAIAAVNIARLTEKPSMLPFALYLVCNSPRRMVDGYERRDGSIEYLTAEDLKLCIVARSILAWELASLIKHVYTLTPSTGCLRKTTGQCITAREDILEVAERNARGQCNVFEFHRDSIEDWLSDFSLCRVCKREMLAREVQERRRVWMLLPEMFGLTADKCGFTSGGGESDSDS